MHVDFSSSVPSGIMQNCQFRQGNSRRNIMEKISRLITKDFMEIMVYQMITGRSSSPSVGDQQRTDWTVDSDHDKDTLEALSILNHNRPFIFNFHSPAKSHK